MAKNRNIKVDILLGLKGKGIDEAVKDTKRLGKNLSDLTGTALKAGAAFAAFQGGRLLGDFAKDALENATSLERGLAGLNAIFEDQSEVMLQYARNASSIGLSMTEATSAATFLGSVIKSAGFDIESASQITRELIDLSADLAITYQRDVSEALVAIAALFRGEYDPIEKFGVAMKQNEIENIKAARSLDHLTGRAEIFADVQIRLEQLMVRSADAQGQFAAQTDTLFVAQQVLAAEFENMKAIVGLQLTPAFADLTANIIPLVETLTPVLVQLFKELIPVVQTLAQNKEQVVRVVMQAITVFTLIINVIANVAQVIATNIEMFKNLAVAIVTFMGVTKLLQGYIGAIQLATGVTRAFGITVNLSARALRNLRLAMLGTGVGILIAGIGFAAETIARATQKTENFVDSFDALDQINFEDYAYGAEFAAAATEDLTEGLNEAGGSAKQAKDAVGDFFRNLENEAAKQAAKVQLQALGASEGLIQAVLGSGDEWFKVFAEVTRRGAESIREVQQAFAATPAGFDEAMQEFEKAKREFEAFRDRANDARDSIIDFVRGFDILPTVTAELGRFEQAAVDHLTEIEEKLTDAFDQGFMLEQSYNDLRDYARQELGVLRQIEKQRDDLLKRRDAAARLIDSVNDAVLSTGRLVDVLKDVQQETQDVDMVKVVKDTIEEASGLREFEVILTSSVVKPIEEVKSKSQLLVSGYKDIVDRTRLFVRQMKDLRDLGLDPQLFNELVEAGVEAGGETAAALLSGGASTVREVNSLFDELNALGEELGEETAQVMYGQGETFVDGIVQGIEAQATALEAEAQLIAEAFTTTFEEELNKGINLAIEAAKPDPIEIEIDYGAVPQLPDVLTGGGGIQIGPQDVPTPGAPILSGAAMREFKGVGITAPEPEIEEEPTFGQRIRDYFVSIMDEARDFRTNFNNFWEELFPGINEEIDTGFENLKTGFVNFFTGEGDNYDLSLPGIIERSVVLTDLRLHEINRNFENFTEDVGKTLGEDGLVGQVRGFFDRVDERTKTWAETLRTRFKSAFDDVKEQTQTWIADRTEDFENFIPELKAKAILMVEEFLLGWTERWNELKVWFDETFKNEDGEFKSFFDIVEDLKEIGRNIFDGFLAGLKEKWEDVKTWAREAVDNLKDIFKVELKTSSPSKVFEDIGMDVGQGLVNGLEAMNPSVIRATNNLVPSPNISAVGGIGGGGNTFVVNANSRSDGAAIAKTISNYSTKNTGRLQDSYQRRKLTVV